MEEEAVIAAGREILGQIIQSEGHRPSNNDYSDTISHLGSIASEVGLLLDVNDNTVDMAL